MKKLIIAIATLGILAWSCEEEWPDQICEMDFSTPPGVVSKFEKWKKPSYFRGFNVGYYCSNTDCRKTQDDIDALKASGANLAQINIYGEGFREFSSPYDVNEVGKQHIICMASYAHTAGLYYTVAVREGPGRHDCSDDKESPIWTNREMQEAYGMMLKEIASEFMDDSLFVGLVMTVEPDPLTAGWDNINEHKSDLQSNNIDLYEIYKIWIDEVRTVSTDLPLMVQSSAYSNPEFWGDEVFIKKQSDPYIVYEVHSYEPFEYTHANRMDRESYPFTGWNITTNNNEEVWDKAFYESTVFKHTINFQQKHNVPVYLGEFGMYYPQLNGETYLSDIYSIAVSNGWSFCLWSWRADKSDKHIDFNYEKFDQNSSGTDYWGTIKQMMN